MSQMSPGLAPGLFTARPAFPSLQAQRGHESIEALRSMWSGPTAPASPVRGQLWLDTSGAGPIYPVNIYDGAAWALFTVYTGTDAALAERLRVDAAQSLTTPKQAQGRANLGLGALAVLSVLDAALITSGLVPVARFPAGITPPPGAIINSMLDPGAGYIEARGGTASRTGLAALFAAYGTRFGAGDGSTTFGLPFLDQTPDYLSATALPAALSHHTATLLADGRIMVIGGSNDGGTTSVATVYFGTISGATIAWATGTALPAATRVHTATLLPDGRIMVVGGFTTASTAAVHFGTISGNTVTWASGTALPAATSFHTTTLLPDGRIMVAGGFDGSASIATVRFGTISGNTITWAAGTALPAATRLHTATLLSDGRVVIIGGFTTVAVATVTFCTIATNTVTYASGTALPVATNQHTTTLLPDGRIMVAGGSDGTNNLATVRFGTIATNTITWTTGSPLSAATRLPAAPLLRDGRVLIVGGLTTVSIATVTFGFLARPFIKT